MDEPIGVPAAMCGLAVQLMHTALSEGGFISPLSIYAALLLALNAAGLPSCTHGELSRMLAGASMDKRACPAVESAADAAVVEEQLNVAFSGVSAALGKANSAGAQLVIANSLWTNGMVLRPQYVEAMQKLMQATVQQAQSADDINAWVSRATRGMIKQLMPPGTDFEAVLANAVYFKGTWQHAFDKAATEQRPFEVKPGAPPVQVPMMAHTFKRSGSGASAAFSRPVLTRTVAGQYEAVRLPYQGDAYSAIALLPDSSTDHTAAGSGSARPSATTASEQLLSSGSLDLQALLEPSGWQPLASQDSDLRLLLPKFKAGSRLSLGTALQRLGVVAAFGSGADFGRLADGPLQISDVLHSAVVEVDEEGTEAAAATAVIMTRSMPRPPRQLVFDRPFVFVVVHDASNTPLFVGTVTDPAQVPQL